MEAKHTPGPWRMQMFRRAIANDEVPRIYSASGYDVAEAISKDDARLIAAAPELLEALQSLIDMDVAYQRGPRVFQAAEKARAAIAKATGSAQ